MKATIIKDFPNYVITTEADVINGETNHRVTKRLIRGYYYVDLRYKGKRKNARLGRLMATCFIPNPKNKPQVNHIDGNCLNDKLSNLEWCTVTENQIHKNRLARENGTYKKPIGNRSISDRKVENIKTLRKKGYTHREIATRLSIGVSTVTHILLGSRRAI